MIKTDFREELKMEYPVNKGMVDSGRDNRVQRVQEWLNLWSYFHPDWWIRIAIDGDYGPITKSAVRKFQHVFSGHGMKVTGEIDETTWLLLTTPLREAFNVVMSPNVSTGELVSVIAAKHLSQCPRELNGINEGPWIRSYCDGLDGKNYAWCVGFCQTILDQAFSMKGKSYTDYYPKTLHCDPVGREAKKSGRFISHVELMKLSDIKIAKKVSPGDLFNIYSPKRGYWVWSHQGIIVGVDGRNLITIEGNSNDEGSREGYEVCQRIRNVDRERLDIIKQPSIKL